MMDALEQARREIDTVDAQLAALFERRMKAVLSVAEYTKAHGLPIFDAAREKVVLDKAEARIGDPALRPYYRDHVQNMMDVAKQYEAEVLGRYADRLEQSADREDTVRTLLQEPLEQHGRILFNGDGYSEEWQQEAERRGLLNLRTAPEAFAHLTEEKNVALFAKHGIFTAAELTSRQEIHYETYAKCIRIEAATMAEMVRRQILPAGQAALRELGQTSRAKQEISPLLSCKAEELLGTQIANYNDMLLAGCTLLENLLRDFPSSTEEQKALYARDRLLPAMNELRQAADALEQLCPAHLWPMPTYGELLYGV